jgi:hypothetical protein
MMDFSDMINSGIFGMIQSGKTTLARKIAWHFWRQNGQRSIYYDPKHDPARNWWPECGTVFYDETDFWNATAKEQNLVVVVDEAAVSISRNRDLMWVFTMMNGRRHRLIVVGHSGSDLLPGMRQQLGYLFLFRQSIEAADMWQRDFADPGIMAATSLNQFEFLMAARFKAAQKFQLTK